MLAKELDLFVVSAGQGDLLERWRSVKPKYKKNKETGLDYFLQILNPEYLDKFFPLIPWDDVQEFRQFFRNSVSDDEAREFFTYMLQPGNMWLELKCSQNLRNYLRAIIERAKVFSRGRFSMEDSLLFLSGGVRFFRGIKGETFNSKKQLISYLVKNLDTYSQLDSEQFASEMDFIYQEFGGEGTFSLTGTSAIPVLVNFLLGIVPDPVDRLIITVEGIHIKTSRGSLCYDLGEILFSEPQKQITVGLLDKLGAKAEDKGFLLIGEKQEIVPADDATGIIYSIDLKYTEKSTILPIDLNGKQCLIAFTYTPVFFFLDKSTNTGATLEITSLEDCDRIISLMIKPETNFKQLPELRIENTDVLSMEYRIVKNVYHFDLKPSRVYYEDPTHSLKRVQVDLKFFFKGNTIDFVVFPVFCINKIPRLNIIMDGNKVICKTTNGQPTSITILLNNNELLSKKTAYATYELSKYFFYAKRIALLQVMQDGKLVFSELYPTYKMRSTARFKESIYNWTYNPLKLMQFFQPNLNLEKHNLREKNFSSMDLSNTNFNYADLSGSVFCGSILRRTTFINANLASANCSQVLSKKNCDKIITKIKLVIITSFFLIAFFMSNTFFGNFASGEYDDGATKLLILAGYYVILLFSLRPRGLCLTKLNADLYKANLQRTSFMGSNLSKSNFKDANLTEANLSNANLSEAVFTNADLSRANLIESQLQRTRFNKANLSEANCFGIHARSESKIFHLISTIKYLFLVYFIVRYVNILSNIKWYNNNSDKSVLYGLLFALYILVIITGPRLVPFSYMKKKRIQADFSDAILFRASFIGAVLSRSDFRGANVQEADFTNADLKGANFRGVDLSSAIFNGADMKGALISKKYQTAKALMEVKNKDAIIFIADMAISAPDQKAICAKEATEDDLLRMKKSVSIAFVYILSAIILLFIFAFLVS